MSSLRSLLLILFLLPSLIFGQELLGDWSGILRVQGKEIPLVFHFTKEGSIYAGTMDSPSQGATGLTCKEVTIVNGDVFVDIQTIGASYKGELKGDSIFGYFVQSGYKFPLDLVKGELEQVEAVRPQTPKPKFNYLIEEVKFFNAEDSIWLAGTLTKPKEGGDFPVVVLSSGSGPQDRNSEIFDHKSFWVIADYLTINGIAVLRFDDRGVGQSEGDYKTSGLEDFARDVTSAVNFAKTLDGLDSNNVTVVGHSEGACLAIMTAHATQLASVVMLAGMAIPGDEIMLLQKKKLESGMGLDEASIANGQQMMSGAYDIIKNSGLVGEELKDTLRNYFRGIYGPLTDSTVIEGVIKPLSLIEITDIIKFNPEEYFKGLNCPLLAVYGEKDFQVPAKENSKALKSSMKRNKIKGEIVLIDDANHLFQTSETGLLDEYSQIEETISPEALSLLLKWLNSL